MAKTIVPNTLGTEFPSYQHPDGVPRSYPPGRVVEVGNVAGLEAAMALGTLQAGDTIKIVWPGTYRLNATLVQRAPNVHITADTNDPSDVIIEGPGMDNQFFGEVWHGIYSEQPGLRVSNLTLQQFFYHGVTFGAGATDPVFENVHILDCGQQFIKASAFPAAINNGRVIGCRFAYTDGRPMTNHDGAGFFYGSPIDVHNGAGWLVMGSVFSEIVPTPAEIAAATAADPGAYQNLWAPAVYFWNHSSNNIVDSNVFINCGRAVAFGLVLRGGGANDNTGGIIRNNMCVVTPGRLSAEQIADSDGQIIAWDSPGTKILHNSVLTYGQIADAIQGRWSAALEIAGNLSDDSIRMRDGATYSGNGGQLNAQAVWFVDPLNGNLRLNGTGNANVGTTTRSPDCLLDIDGNSRNPTTKQGAHRYG